MRYSGATVSGVIAAPAAAIWELVGDVARHPEIAGSGEVRGVSLVGGGPVGVGSVFQSQQNLRGIPYVTANRVVIWEPPFRFGWRVGVPGLPGVAQTWWFSLSPEAGGTRVENGVALVYALPALPPFSWARERIGRGYAASMRPTLANLARLLDAPPPAYIVERHEPPAALVALMPPAALVGSLILGGAGLVGLALARALRPAR